MIGQRLKLARSGAGLSLRGLESKMEYKVTAQAIGKYERDESMPRSGVLISLADALAVPVTYLLGEQELVLVDAEFRKKQITKKKDEARVKANVLHLLERYLLVEDILGLPSVEWDKPRDAPYPVKTDFAEVELAARNLRAYWGLGQDPIPNFAEMLEARGIKVLMIDDKNIDGLTARVRRQNRSSLPVIVINVNDWAERKRFNLGHEMGHMLLEVDHSMNDEKAAHRFASSFLMPAESMRAEIGKHRRSISLGELLQLKKVFGTSLQAITYRCKDLGIINSALFKQLFRDFDARGWRTHPYEEAGALPPEIEESRRFERLCYRALAESVISEAKVAELIGISVLELNRRMEEPDALPH